MPAAIVVGLEMLGAALLGAGAGVIGAGIMLYASEIAVAIILAGGLAYSASAKRKAERMARAQFNAAQVDRLVNVSATIMPRELVLGRVRKGGAVFFKASTGTNNAQFVMCIALAAHDIDAVETIYLNDQAVTLDGSGYVQEEPYKMARLEDAVGTYTGNSIVLPYTPVDSAAVTVWISLPFQGVGMDGIGASPGEQIAFTLTGATVSTDAAYAGQVKTVQYQYNASTSRAKIRSYLGTAGQTADATLISLFPALWTSAHRARGVAYLICEFDYDETAFPSGLPNVTAVIRGAKCYDPRTGTTVWTENPALMARHVLTHPQFGKRTSITAAEDARITTAANACDVATVYTVGGVAQASRALYQASLVLPFGATARDALDDIVQAMAGQWAYAAGEFHIRAGSYTASVNIGNPFTDADLAVVQRGADGSASQSPIQITTHRARDQMVNVITATIWDKDQDYKQTALTPLKGTALITRDGAELTQDVTMPAVGYAPQALHIAGIIMRDARDPLTVTLPFKLSAYRIELFDTVSLTLVRYGWSAKTFIVIGREWAGDGAIKLTLKENDATIYTRDADFLAQGYAVNTGLPAPWDVPALAGLSVTSGPGEALLQPDGTYLARMRVAWTAFTDLTVTQGGSVEVQYFPAVSVEGPRSVITSGADTQIVITNVSPGTNYIIRARARTPVALGNWCAQVVHLCEGLGSPVVEFRQHTEGWPGTLTNGMITAPGIEATDSAIWTTPASWTAFTRWNTTPASSLVYTDTVRDLGVVMVGGIVPEYDADGSAVVEVRGSAVSSGDVASQPWASTAASLNARWVQVRITVTAITSQPVPAVRTLGYSYNVLKQFERWIGLVPSALLAGRLAPGDFRLPLRKRYSVISYVAVTPQDPRAGAWTWGLVDKDTTIGPRIQVRLDGVLTDPASIDAYLEGA